MQGDPKETVKLILISSPQLLFYKMKWKKEDKRPRGLNADAIL